MNQLAIGMLAHVDAGKTTLSEAMLYLSGTIRRLGRVDDRDAFLDTDRLERMRGITIFSKQAVLKLDDWQLTLLDTPGHVDFSAEMERTLQVLDYAILIISGADGVQGHTETLWRLLKQYRIPVFIFVNKMDQEGTSKERLMEELKRNLHDNCVDFTDCWQEAFYEAVAVCEEKCLEQYLRQGSVDRESVRKLIRDRLLFPVFFGSALKLSGIEEFMREMAGLLLATPYPQEFGARVFKIARDGQGNRLTYLKVTGGELKVKDTLPGTEEKINQIRVYSGERFESVNVLKAGGVCAVTGLKTPRPGQGIGREEGMTVPLLEPVLYYRIALPEGMDIAQFLPKLRQLEEEEPQLHLVYQEELKELQAQVMGEVQLEVLKSLIQERFGVEVTFGDGNIVYKETIASPVEGVGHYEPLRHYAEVHLLLEPLERGSGLQFCTNASVDELDGNWQRLVMTHLQEKEHRGVLTGSSLTDLRITLTAGKAHPKHTEGGDFRQATYRAVRQGLMQAESILLEPCYAFCLEVPSEMTGRAMSDLDRRYADFTIRQSVQDVTVLEGTIPAACVRNYQQEVYAYTKGRGRFSCRLKGYEPCHNTEEVLELSAYDAEADLENPASSVFCAHGAGFVVAWDQVPSYMHLPSTLRKEGNREGEASCDSVTQAGAARRKEKTEEWVGTDEIDAILEKTFYANRRENEKPRHGYMRKKAAPAQAPVTVNYQKKKTEAGKEYLLVDGYNVIFAWPELKELAAVNIDSARGKLQDILCNYQAFKGCELILVFDAYRVQGHETEILNYHNIHVVYTKEAETADQYIEKFAHENKGRYRVNVATSDGLEQIIIRGQGCGLLSARELEEEVKRSGKEHFEAWKQSQQQSRTYLSDLLPADIAECDKKT